MIETQSYNDPKMKREKPLAYVLYKCEDNQWSFLQSTVELVPQKMYIDALHKESFSDPLGEVVKIEINNDVLQFSFVIFFNKEKKLLEFVRNSKTGFFELSHSDSKHFMLENGKMILELEKRSQRKDSYDDETRINLAVQSRNSYNLCVINKSTELGIVPPSIDNDPGIIPPKWIIPSGNEKTMKLMLDYYKTDYVEDFVRGYGYNNFYEFTTYIPVLHYSICGDNMVVSYVFMDCFFEHCHLHNRENVWAGVDFYKLDPERGPIKTSSFTRSSLLPLKEAPVE